MKRTSKAPHSSLGTLSCVLLGIVILAAVFLLADFTPSAESPVPGADESSATVTNPTTSLTEVTVVEPQPASAVALQTNTAPTQPDPIGDGKSEAVIRRWAHNELEVQRMLGENDRVYRRQLVPLKETAAAVVERHRLTGDPVRQLTLPGLDGQEIQFEITQSDLNPSGQQGTFSGRVVGRVDSMVTLAFKGGREAFTVISPADNLYLFGDPHEPGDVIVKSVDISKYPIGDCGVAFSTTPTNSGSSNEHQR